MACDDKIIVFYDQIVHRRSWQVEFEAAAMSRVVNRE